MTRWAILCAVVATTVFSSRWFPSELDKTLDTVPIGVATLWQAEPPGTILCVVGPYNENHDETEMLPPVALKEMRRQAFGNEGDALLVRARPSATVEIVWTDFRVANNTKVCAEAADTAIFVNDGHIALVR